MFTIPTSTRSLWLSALALCLSPLLYGQAAPSENPPATPSSQEKELRKVSLQIAPVGARRLAQFGAGKQQAPRKKAAPPKAGSDTSSTGSGSAGETEGKEKEIDSQKAAGGNTSFRVLDVPEDERPPQSIYVKTATNKYQQIICSFNAISPAVEFPIKGEKLVLYRKLPPKKAGQPVRYKPFADFTLPKGNRNVLVTIAKPLKTKKWTNPIISAHDLTNLKDGSITVINTSDEQVIGCQVNDQKKSLAKRRGRITYDSTSGKKVARVVMTGQYGRRNPDTNALVPFHDGFYKMKSDQKMLILAYSVTPKESPKGAKFVRTSLDF